MERELFEPIDIADADGRLRRDAVGWSRRPLHRCALPRGLGARKRWNYWCITTDQHLFSITVADVDLASVVVLSFLDFEDQAPIERVLLRPFGLKTKLADDPRGGDVMVESSGLKLSMRETHQATRLEGAFQERFGARVTFDLTIERPDSHETLNVLVPWDARHYQFTSKQTALPTTGVVRVSGAGPWSRHRLRSKLHRFDRDNHAFACLDFGRGVWPHRTEWNWASASGVQRGRTIGLNFGGKWTDGTGVTENGFVVDGRLHKISDDVEFTYDRADFERPWSLRTRGSSRVDLRFTPVRERALSLGAFALSAELHLCLGRFDGTLIDDAGDALAIESLFGWAEELRARW